jgi:uncharacterized membrane protein YeaQ/YmgE (transglycosylase-associated protein family)
MSWITAIFVGALIGWVASIIARTNDQMGCLWNIAIGIVGAALGRWLAEAALKMRIEEGFSLEGFLAGVVGAVVLIVLLRALGIFKRGR